MIKEKNLANPGNITMATDWAMKRQAHQVVLFLRIITDFQYLLVMQKQDSRERIVNRGGQVVSRWESV